MDMDLDIEFNVEQDDASTTEGDKNTRATFSVCASNSIGCIRTGLSLEMAEKLAEYLNQQIYSENLERKIKKLAQAQAETRAEELREIFKALARHYERLSEPNISEPDNDDSSSFSLS